MDEKAYKLEIVTPRKSVFNGDVVSFSAPGVIGGFQVLYNHAPLLAEIGIGEIKLRDAGGKELRFATSGGFVDVNANHVVVLAESAEDSDEIDVQRAEAARQRAQARLEEKEAEVDDVRARAALYRADNRLKVARRK